MREGKARKKANGAIESTNIASAISNTSTVPPLEEQKFQLLRDLAPVGQPLAISRIVLKDGKPVIEKSTSDVSVYNNQTQLVEVIKKPQHVTSLSFMNRVHTDKWTEQENRKFFKVNYL